MSNDRDKNSSKRLMKQKQKHALIRVLQAINLLNNLFLLRRKDNGCGRT